MADDFYEIMRDSGAELHELIDRERWQEMQSWREVFAAPYHNETGKWKRGKYEWHIFSFNHTPSISGEKALTRYQAQPVEKYYVVPEGGILTAYLCVGGRLPNLRLLLEDIYVWPDDLSWTMAFTHEMDVWLGPYFCLREWIS